MVEMKAVNSGKQIVLANDVAVADTVLTRLVGLLGKSCLPSGKGLLITPCKGVHTFGMRFPIDVLFISASRRVVAAASNLEPNRVTRLYKDSASVLELPAGVIEATGTIIGDEVEFV